MMKGSTMAPVAETGVSAISLAPTQASSEGTNLGIHIEGGGEAPKRGGGGRGEPPRKFQPLSL